MTERRCWAILTGEYPPAPGGVSDYTQQVARALACAGDYVHVFTAPPRDPNSRETMSSGASVEPIHVEVLPDHFGLQSLSTLDARLDRLPRPREILVQYVPHAFGCRAMNIGFCAWLLARSRTDRITITFHEVTFPMRAGQPVHHNLLGLVNHAMAAMLVRAASRAIVTIPAWARLLKRLGARCEIRVVPVPSNLPLVVGPESVARARAKYHCGTGEALIGTFGSFGPLVAPLLDELVPRLAAQELGTLLLIGRGSERYRHRLSKVANVVATGPLHPNETAAAIAACDVMIQPFPDGVSARRSSAAAALALGVPIVTNTGELSESFWRDSDAVALTESSDQIPDLAAALLNDAPRRARLIAAAKQLYEQRFALRHTIDALRECRSPVATS